MVGDGYYKERVVDSGRGVLGGRDAYTLADMAKPNSGEGCDAIRSVESLSRPYRKMAEAFSFPSQCKVDGVRKWAV